MKVGALHITHYETSKGPYETSFVKNPGWEQIVESIDRLDRDLWPFVWIYLDPEASDSELPDFEIMGGCDAYVIAGKSAECGEVQVFLEDPNGSENPIDVWVSDQGATFPARMVTDDLNEVYEIARHFFETGALPPNDKLRRTKQWCPTR